MMRNPLLIIIIIFFFFVSSVSGTVGGQAYWGVCGILMSQDDTCARMVLNILRHSFDFRPYLFRSPMGPVMLFFNNITKRLLNQVCI